MTGFEEPVLPFDYSPGCVDYENQGFIEFYHISYSYLGTVAFLPTVIVGALLSLIPYFKKSENLPGTTWSNRHLLKPDETISKCDEGFDDKITKYWSIFFDKIKNFPTEKY